MTPERTGAGPAQRLRNTLGGYWLSFRREGRILTNVIVFMVVSAILVAVLIVSIFRVQPRYSVYATFADSGGVFTRQEVAYRGVTVGRVGHMQVVREGVRIELQIEERFNQIPRQDLRARVMFKSAVGEQFVDLLPQRRTAPYLEAGDEIPIERTELPVQQEELLRLLDTVLAGVPPESLRNLVNVLGQGLSGRGDQLHTGLAALDPLTDTLSQRTDELNRIATSGDRLGAAFSDTSSEFVAGVRGLGRVATALGEGAPGLERLLVAGARDIPEIGALIAARKAELDRILRNLAVVTGVSFENLQSVEDTLDWLPILLQTLIDVYDADTNRFRFGLIAAELRAPPCSYGTPRRTGDEHGNAPYHPVLDFECL